jgi:ABC-type nitrate/sulfonate/bicarbonate transport system ATPase subunit
LIVTHDVDEAVAIADRVVVLGGAPAKVHAQIVGADREAVFDALGFTKREEHRRRAGLLH